MPPRVKFSSQAQSLLVELMQPHDPSLSLLQSEIADIDSQISTDRASAIPWVSVVSLDYGVDENANDQTREEWGIFAGIGLPVGRWVNKKPLRALLVQKESAQQQVALVQKKLQLRIIDLCQSLEVAQSDWASFERKSRPARQNIEKQMAQLGDNDITSRQTRIALNESLLAMELRELELMYETGRVLFDLCEMVGYNLDDIITLSSAGN